MKRDWAVKTAIISLCAAIGLTVGVGSAFATQILSDDVKGEVPLDRPQTKKQQSDLVPEHLKPKEDQETQDQPKVKGERPPDRHPSSPNQRQQLVPEKPKLDSPEQKTDSSQEEESSHKKESSSQQQKEQQEKQRQEQEQQRREQLEKQRQEQEQKQKEEQEKQRQEQEQQKKEQQEKQRQEQEQQRKEQLEKQRQEQEQKQKEEQEKQRQEQEQQKKEQQEKQRQEQEQQKQPDSYSGEVVEKHAKSWQLAEDEEKSEEEIAVSEIFGLFNRSEPKVKEELKQYTEELEKKNSFSTQQKSESKSQANQEDEEQQGSMLDEDQPPRTVKNGKLPMTASNDLNHVLIGCFMALTGILYISLRKVEL